MENAEKYVQTIASLVERCEKNQGKFAQGTSQHTLLVNRTNALNTAMFLLKNENADANSLHEISEIDLKNAVAPITSLISKSQKAQQKLKQGTWQHTMLENNLKALNAALLLI